MVRRLPRLLPWVALLLSALPRLASALVALEGRAIDVTCAPSACIDTYSITDPQAIGLQAGISAGQSAASSGGNLATGSLSGVAIAAPFSAAVAVNPFGSLARAQVSLGDTVHVLGPVLSPVTGFLTARVQGQLTRGLELPGAAGNSARGELSIRVDDGTGAQHFDDLLGCLRNGPACQPMTVIDRQLVVPFLITPTLRNFQFDISLTAIAQVGGMADFSPATQLTLALPAGLSFSSDSGLFLSQAVPEPAAAALWLLGLTGLAGLAAWRRRPGTAA